ncbi:CoA activase [Candidatus Poribacteria bacterium]|nr:CoA activase [Candidatus Poribacteria bacterium]
MTLPFHILGVDIGSVSISVAEINHKGEIARTAYELHHGNIPEALKSILTHFDLRQIGWIAATTSTPPILRTTRRYDNRVSVIAACRHLHPEFGAILIVGGERFGLVSFSEGGSRLHFKANTSCAAGTGSFLDQQARRLNLGSIEDLSKTAFRNTGGIPKIASRCAVFAKTDLVHAQQEGFRLEEICDGLCYGLAKNVVDTLFTSDKPRPPMIFSGGVSRNMAVVRHIEAMTGVRVIVEKAPYGAVGAALSLLAELHLHDPLPIASADDVLCAQDIGEKKYFFEPLELRLADYPDFRGVESYEYSGLNPILPNTVEIDIYEDLKERGEVKAYLGIDIGSTSTKAALVDPDKAVLAGFYTQTAGRPVMAVQSLFASISDMIEKKGIDLRIAAVAVTGSGRKLLGKIVGADLVVDEITAHARAAIELKPDVDTIIEIGGQDSKFTTLANGAVTFSVMNTVCAAGTGSFIEEQAQKFGCPLSEYSSRTEHKRSPIVSDRCTVFMERDMNHFLSEGYSVNEVLAAALHSITENYLTKVAIENSIGKVICFQGATAKNRALVAAFEQRLGKPLHVSRYCHLTGAIGAAIMLLEQAVSTTGFKGLDIHKKRIPIRSEVCELCANHCKITIADLECEPVAYGFLCGRDYDVQRRVDNNRSGFDLLKARRKSFSFEPKPERCARLTIGIPSALHLYEDLASWRMFFNELSITTVTSEGYDQAIRDGRKIARAEFCAPMIALHGHVKYLLDKADYVFLPVYLEKKEKGGRRQYCYYTQYSPVLCSTLENGDDTGADGKSKILAPLIQYLYPSLHAKTQLYRLLKGIVRDGIRFMDVSTAYDKAFEFKKSALSKLNETYIAESARTDDVHVVLLGRPYTVLSESMNKGIHRIFASLGIKTFFQDMIHCDEQGVQSVRPLLEQFHWYYASEILKAAEATARADGAYPVLVTSFRCSPDSFVIEYFKKLMESHKKPYLVLQLDEHSSSVGYETRIEAAIRSFRNHRRGRTAKTPASSARPFIRTNKNELAHKTLIIPNWDNISLRLVAANLRREGIDARLLEENNTSIRKSLRNNTGQCIPLNIMTQEFVDYVETHGLDPSNTVLWTAESAIACNIGLFPCYTKTLLNSYGNGFEKAGVYAGGLSFADISLKLPVNTYFAFMFGGMIKKMGCKLRPYEKVRGTTDKVIAAGIDIMVDAFSGNRSKETALAEVVSRFTAIDSESAGSAPRPKLAIFGDLYARDNDIMNQDLIHFIEDNGGEVVTTPYTSYVKMVTRPYVRKWFIEGNYTGAFSSKALIAAVTHMENKYYKYFERILKEPDPLYDESAEEILAQYHVRLEHTGESMDNLLKIFYLVRRHPDITLFIQTSPAFCCPSLVTEAMAQEIENKTGVPVVSITYDGTGGNKNEVIIPYLKKASFPSF